MFVGLIVGMIIGVIGNITRIGTLEPGARSQTWPLPVVPLWLSSPRLAGLFASAFTTITDYSRKTMKNSKYGKDREFIIAVNDALAYGETATLTTGLLVIRLLCWWLFLSPAILFCRLWFCLRCHTWLKFLCL